MALTRIRRIGLPMVAAIAVSAAVAAPAIAAPSLAPGIGTYKTWAEAQRAVGFKLWKPTVTYNLPNVGHVIASVCEAAPKKRVVTVSYGNFNTRNVGLSETNSGGGCGVGDQGTFLANYKIHGVAAKLYGYCDILGAPSCTSAKLELWLVWKTKALFFVASSFNESRKNLVNFATKLKAA
jgi:hypothetical protein